MRLYHSVEMQKFTVCKLLVIMQFPTVHVDSNINDFIERNVTNSRQVPRYQLRLDASIK